MFVENRTFENQTVEIDGKEFKGCVFKNCLIQFNGKAPFGEISGCTFDGCGLGIGGTAELTIDYLRQIYHGLGNWGKVSVETLFDEIRKPAHKNMH